MKKTVKKSYLLRNTVFILIGCVIIGLVLSLVLFARDNNRTYTSANLSFTFDGAQDGLAPNGYLFDVQEICSEHVLTSALENAGMTARYTFEELQPNLAVQGVYPEDLVSQMTRYSSVTDTSSSQTLTLSKYYPTVFNVVLYNDFDPSISQSDLKALLNSILTVYRDLFAQEYAMISIDGIDVQLLDGYDYFQQLELLQFKLNQAKSYADEMSEKVPALRVEDRDFSDLSLQFASMINNDLSRLNATMTMNALSMNLDRLKDQYTQEIQDLKKRVEIQNRLIEKLDVLISVYGKSGIIYLSTSETLNRVDSQSSRIYDKLVDTRNSVTDGIAALNSQIANYQNKLDELESGEIENAVDDVIKAANAKAEENTVDADAEDTAEVTLDISDVTVDELLDDEEVSDKEYEGILSDATTDQKKMILETGITRLAGKVNESIDTLTQMIKVFNEQEINDLTVIQSRIRYKTPSVFSGTFIVLAVKTTGPIFVLGLIAVLVLLIISRRKEQKIKKNSCTDRS